MISNRLQTIPESTTLAVTSRAARLQAEGHDVIGFGAGEPDFPTPAHIVEAAARACADPRNHRYSPTAGLPELRAAVAGAMSGTSRVASSQVLITNGAKHAVLTALAAVVDEGDEVLVPAPFWVTYPEAVRLLGGRPVEVPWDTGFKVDVEALAAVFTSRTKALIVGSPSNPSGAVYSPEETAALAAWASERGLWIVSDEIYRDLVYPPASFTSIADYAAPDRTLVIGGVSKTYAMTGWRVGWLIGPQAAIRACINFQSHTTSNVNNVAQVAALAALQGDQAPAARMLAIFDERRRKIVKHLSELPGVTLVEPQGAFYAFPDVSGLLDHSVGSWRPSTSAELAEALLEEAGVATVPGEGFGAPGHLRFSYALSEDALDDGMDRLHRLLA